MSHFPSLEDFEEGGTATAAGEGTSSLDVLDDPASDFLSREKATLGADADLFNSQDDDILGGGAGGQDDMMSGEAFPDLNMGNEAVGPGGTITGGAEPYMPGSGMGAAGAGVGFGAPAIEEEEPEAVRQWRERRELEIQKRDELSASRKADTISKAQTAIDDFYDNYNLKRDKLVEETRREAQEFLDSRENTVAGGTAWERIAKLVDLREKQGGGREGPGKQRFREMLVSLRKDEKAPGASGL